MGETAVMLVIEKTVVEVCVVLGRRFFRCVVYGGDRCCIVLLCIEKTLWSGALCKGKIIVVVTCVWGDRCCIVLCIGSRLL